MHPRVKELVTLTQRFLAGEVDAPTFDDTFRKLFSRLPLLDEETFVILERLAFACEDYVEDPELRDEPGDLDEQGLAEAARVALEQLGVS